MKTKLSQQFQTLLLLGTALFLITIVLFSPVRHFEFINHDDDQYILSNPHIAQGLTWEGLRWAFTAGLTHSSLRTDYWQPLTILSRMLDIEFFGLNPAAHHLTNLFLHAINVLLLFCLLAWLSESRTKSFFVALLFAVHPVQIEAVAWVTARKDLLSGFFILLTLFAYARSRRAQTAACYAGALFFYLCATLSKPVPMFPVLLLCFDFWPLNRWDWKQEWKRSVKILIEKIPFFAVSTLSLIVLHAPAFQTVNYFELFIPRGLPAYAHYLKTLVWPVKVGIYGPGALEVLPPDWMAILLIFLLLAGISYCIIRRAEKFRFVAAGWFWFLAGLLPVVGFVYPADRFLYLPMVGLAIVFVWGIAHYLRRKTALIFTEGSLIILTVLTAQQLGYWRNNRTLFQRALVINPANYLALANVGNILGYSGKTEEASAFFRKSIASNPFYAPAYTGLGVIAEGRGDFRAAANYYGEAIRHDTQLLVAYSNLANIFLGMGKTAQAIEFYEKALTRDPVYFQSHLGLGNAFVQQGLWKESAQHFSRALHIKPDSKPAQMGLIFAQRNLEASLSNDPSQNSKEQNLQEIRNRKT